MRGTEGFQKGDRVLLKSGEEVTITRIIGVPVMIRSGIETRCAYTGVSGPNQPSVHFRLDQIEKIVKPYSELVSYRCSKCQREKPIYPNMMNTYRREGMCEDCKRKEEIEAYQVSFDRTGRPLAGRMAQGTNPMFAHVAPCNLGSIKTPSIWSPNNAPIDLSKTASFTGHRPDKLCTDKRMAYRADNPVMLKVRKALEDEIGQAIEEGITTFISGMALGVDQVAAEVVLEFRDNLAAYVNIQLVAAVPFFGQEKKWPKPSQDHFHDILRQADGVVYVHEPKWDANGEAIVENLPFQLVRTLMQDRNEWMVDHSKRVIAVWDGTHGGTGNCVSYANSAPHKPELVCIDPKPFKHITKGGR